MSQGYDCYDCHDLSTLPGAGAPGTSYLSASARNIAEIRSANGGSIPDRFGCLYCHNSSVLKDDPDTPGILLENRMRDASDHFRGKASFHPVGYDLTTMSDTKGHLLSTFDLNGDGVGDRATELDCVDCHDVAQSIGFLGYPQHGRPLATNPFMLRAGAETGFNLAAGEYDGVCRRCHGSATGAGGIAGFKSTGKDLRLTETAAHADGSDTTTNVMRESDGTLLKTADLDNDGVADTGLRRQCTSCHESHFSPTNKKLFAARIDVSNGSRCADCHFPGDNSNLDEGGAFVKYGHGKAGIGFICSSCHSVNGEHDASNPANGPKMLSFPRDATPSKYGKDLLSICKTCHGRYSAHTGPGGEDVGCVDCHDEHAEGVGSTSNRSMIPQRLPNNHTSTELSFFQSAGDPVAPAEWDYFVADDNARKEVDMPGAESAGACDNSVCHAGIVAGGTPITPLSTFMPSGNHSGGDQPPGSNCRACHAHPE